MNRRTFFMTLPALTVLADTSASRAGETSVVTQATLGAAGELQPIAHELQVALNGLCADLQLVSEGGGVRIPTRFEDLMDLQHPRQRRTRAPVVLGLAAGGQCY